MSKPPTEPQPPRSVFSQIGTYSPIVERPWVHWPDNARLALWIVPNIEYTKCSRRWENSMPGRAVRTPTS